MMNTVKKKKKREKKGKCGPKLQTSNYKMTSAENAKYSMK